MQGSACICIRLIKNFEFYHKFSGNPSEGFKKGKDIV